MNVCRFDVTSVPALGIPLGSLVMLVSRGLTCLWSRRAPDECEPLVVGAGTPQEHARFLGLLPRSQAAYHMIVAGGLSDHAKALRGDAPRTSESIRTARCGVPAGDRDKMGHWRNLGGPLPGSGSWGGSPYLCARDRLDVAGRDSLGDPQAYLSSVTSSGSKRTEPPRR